MAQDKQVIARPYAVAVLTRAQETNSFDIWSNMLNLLSTVVQLKEVEGLVANPKFSRNQVESTLLEVVHDHFNAEGQNLLKMLFKNRRLLLAPQIAATYEQLRRKSQGILQAQVISAYPLDNQQIATIVAALKTRLQHDIEIRAEQDPELIGGALIRVGGIVIDGSVRGQLQRLANQLRFLR